jgi:hypothetical protein
MNHKLTTAALLFGTLLLAGRVYADCPGPFMRDVKRAYENAKTVESQGKKEDALFYYHAALGEVCEGPNPYEADAAKRAAPLALELGAAAEKRGDFEKADRLYDAGGQFAAADRAYMQTVRAKADEPGVYQSALERFRNRDGAFASNNATAIRVTGAYRPDPKFIAEVNAMPAKGIEHATQKEAASFNEEYLRDYVQLIQARPDDSTDANALQRLISAQQAFTQKWKAGDLIEESQDALQNLRMWGFAVQDQKLAATVAAKVAQLSEQRATTLRQKYFAAPKLLDEAMSYYRLPASDNSKAEAQVVAVRTQALKLGDEANTKNRYTLASDYYEVADADDKAEAVRERSRQVAMQKMQPSIDQARKQAEAMQKQFSDPAKVAEMQKQAQAARQAMQQQQAAAKSNNKKSAADLEKELGL